MGAEAALAETATWTILKGNRKSKKPAGSDNPSDHGQTYRST